MKYTAVIMAGGVGERFWPKSRQHCPKQFLSLTADGETMIQKTVKRLLPLVKLEDIYLMTNADYLSLVHEQLPQIPEENILAEPCPRNTAPAIGLAASLIARKEQDAVMFFLPSDHLIQHEEKFISALQKAAQAALQGEKLITLGIQPTYPETGYGYIHYRKTSGDDVFPVEKFVEKPNLPKAEKYLHSGEYLWNSGMFIWKASSILENIRKYMPDLFQGLQPIVKAYHTAQFEEILYQQFPLLPSESIDFGVMEKAEHIFTIRGDFGWDDVGSWLALERINPTDEQHNYFDGEIISSDVKNCTVSGNGKKIIAMLGVEDLVVVDTKDALLICHKQQTQEIKKILAQLKENQRFELL